MWGLSHKKNKNGGILLNQKKINFPPENNVENMIEPQI